MSSSEARYHLFDPILDLKDSLDRAPSLTSNQDGQLPLYLQREHKVLTRRRKKHLMRLPRPPSSHKSENTHKGEVDREVKAYEWRLSFQFSGFSPASDNKPPPDNFNSDRSSSLEAIANKCEALRGCEADFRASEVNLQAATANQFCNNNSNSHTQNSPAISYCKCSQSSEMGSPALQPKGNDIVNYVTTL